MAKAAVDVPKTGAGRPDGAAKPRPRDGAGARALRRAPAPELCRATTRPTCGPPAIPCCLYGPGGGYTGLSRRAHGTSRISRSAPGARASLRSKRRGVTYVDPSTGARPIRSREARWRGTTNGHYLNPAPARTSAAGTSIAARHSVWRYGKALLVETRGDAVSLGEGWTPLISRRMGGGRARPLQARVHDAHRLLQGPGHDRDGLLSQEPRRHARARGLFRQCRRVAFRLYAAAAGLALPHPRCRRPASYPKIAQIAGLRCGRCHHQGVAPGRGGGGAAPERRDLLREPQLAAVLRGGHEDLWPTSSGSSSASARPTIRGGRCGYGSNVLGAERGFSTSSPAAGEICAQARASSACRRPAARHFTPRFAARRRAPGACTEIAPTVAKGSPPPKPTRRGRVLRAVRASGGAVVAVSETEIVAAARPRAPRVYVEPTLPPPPPGSAACSPTASSDRTSTGSGPRWLRAQGLRHHRRAARGSALAASNAMTGRGPR